MRSQLCLGLALLAGLCFDARAEQPDPQLPVLIKALESNDPGARYDALVAIADLGPKADAAIFSLLKVLHDSNDEHRLLAAIALGKIGKFSVQPLADLLNHKDDDIRYHAVWALGLIGPEAKETLKAVVVLTSDKNESVRRKAVYTLGRIDADAAIALPILRARLEDDNALVRRTAADSMARFGEKAVPELIAALKNDHKELKAEVLFALGVIGSNAAEAVPALKVVLFGKDPKESQAAAQTLGKIGKSALPALIDGVNHADANVRRDEVSLSSERGRLQHSRLVRPAFSPLRNSGYAGDFWTPATGRRRASDSFRDR